MSETGEQQAFRDAVYAIVQQIPEGRVMTYGNIAALIPPPSSIDPIAYKRIRARWVGYALKRCPEGVPWHRVVNARGQVSLRHGIGPNLQRAMLEVEGIRFNEKDCLDIKALSWKPDPRAFSVN